MNRRQVVRINDAHSKELTLEYGVPQGPVSGPLFFIWCISDISLYQSSGSVITAIFCTAQTWDNLKMLVESDHLIIYK